MDVDHDCDAPPISAIRTDSPPPQKKKPTVTIRKAGVGGKPVIRIEQVAPTAPATAKPTADEPEDEEDQLIDDDDNDMAKPSPSAGPRPGDTTPKKKPATKRKPRKSDKKPAEADKKAKDPALPPVDTEMLPAEPSAPSEPSTPSKSKAQKGANGRPTIPLPRPKIKIKQKSAIPALLQEDNGHASESYAGTAASSPAPFDHSPEPENIPPSSPPAESAAPLPEEPPNLEGIPIPIYPLPTKPFPVQPPSKIPTGVAPVIPLDKSGKQPRHWREAKREIRGIGGGRWFARTWAGEKESELATYLANEAQSKQEQGNNSNDKSGSTISMPKLPSLSISAPAGGGTGKSAKAKGASKTGSTATSAAPSRAPSAIPDVPGPMITSTVRAPTKMRIQVGPESSDAGDSDMAPPVET